MLAAGHLYKPCLQGEFIKLVQPALTTEDVVIGMVKKFDKCREDETNKDR